AHRPGSDALSGAVRARAARSHRPGTGGTQPRGAGVAAGWPLRPDRPAHGRGALDGLPRIGRARRWRARALRRRADRMGAGPLKDHTPTPSLGPGTHGASSVGLSGSTPNPFVFPYKTP